jgi:hypothetical protein
LASASVTSTVSKVFLNLILVGLSASAQYYSEDYEHHHDEERRDERNHETWATPITAMRTSSRLRTNFTMTFGAGF